MIDIFGRKKKATPVFPLEVDIHSHLLPGIDDGVESVDDALEILRVFIQLGYKRVITTPHIMAEFYPNTPEIILGKLQLLQEAIKAAGMKITVEAAAEYYLDEGFMQMLEEPSKLLTFGKNYLLFETSFLNEPVFLNEAVFKINALGLQPVLAHPERYLYIQANPSVLHELAERNVLFQCNMNAINGYYAKGAKKIAKYLIKNKMVSFLGSDCHNMKHALQMNETVEKKYFHRALELDLLNNQV